MKKLNFALLWAMLVVFWAVGPVQSALAGTYNGGNGSAEKPYRISTPQNMNEIGTDLGDWGSHFVMVNDVNLADYTGTEFNIIGNSIKQFVGVFDGNDHTVSNFTYTTTDTDYIGLFGWVDDANAMIKDLTLVDPNVNTAGESDFVGSLVGVLINGTVTGCGVEGGSVSGGDDATGGLVGGNFYGGTISNCYATGSVTGGNFGTGGLVGSDCEGGTISNCYATGSVTGYGNYTGGLVGCGAYSTTITNCYATGSVTGGEYCSGGLAGGNTYGSTITNCFATGNVVGGNYTGGLVGYNSDSTISGSFWDVETTGQSSSAGGEGKTTAQMQSMTTFTDAGWDFVGEEGNGTDDIWSIHEGINYPVFVWEIVNFVGWYEVDMLDFAFFADRWMNTDCGNWNDCDGTDINFSDSVDMADLVIFANHWLVGK